MGILVTCVIVRQSTLEECQESSIKGADWLDPGLEEWQCLPMSNLGADTSICSQTRILKEVLYEL